MSERTARWGLGVILLMYLVVGAVYSLVAPLGEAPDEMEQFQFMRYIVEQRRLPRTSEDRLAAGGKSHEPPLYYSLLGLATAWVDTRALPQIKMLDPERWPRHSVPDEVLINFAPVHTADESWPFEGAVLIWHLARLLSLGLMAAALVVVFQVVREVLPGQPQIALLSVTLVGLSPQCLYIGASINDDALAALLGALAAWLLVNLAKGHSGWRQFVLLGIVVGLARLTKFYMLALVPEMVIALLALAWLGRTWRYVQGLLAALALSFAIPAPWLFYIQPANAGLTRGWGHLLALLDIVHVERWFSSGGEGKAGTGVLAVGRALLGVFRLEPGAWALTLFKSFWGYFGAMTLQVPPAVYAVAAVLSGLSVLGWLRIAVLRLRRQPSPLDRAQAFGVPALQVLAFLAVEATFYGVMKRLPDTAQARHLYPALAGLALFFPVGWWGLWRGLPSVQWATPLLAALMIGMGVCCLPTAVSAVRLPPLPVRSSPWPDAPSPAQSISLGDGLVFEGARWSAPQPGHVHGTLYWTATQPPSSEAIVVLELLDTEGVVRAVWAGHPGGPRYPTQAWDAGDHVRLDLSWPLPPSFSAPARTLRMHVLREGVQTGSLDLPFDIPAAPGPGFAGAPTPEKAGLRDSLLVAVPGGRIDGLAGPDGSAWEPLARTAAGDQAAFIVDARVKPGDYTLRLAGSQGAGGAFHVTVEGRPRAFEVPGGLNPVGATFGGAVELVGYDLGGATRVTPGDTVHLHLVWRARGRIDRHYTVFTHLVDAQGHTWAQHDKLPGQEYSTLFWAPGEVVVDEYTLRVDPAAPAGEYRVEVGLYQALTGARAPVFGAHGQAAGDYVVLGPVEVGQ